MRFTQTFVTLMLLTFGTVSADEVIHWNNVLLDSIRTTSTPPPRASRAMAMVQTAVYDAVNSIEGTHQPYHVSMPMPGASAECAAAQAAHDVLVGLFPTQQAALNAELANRLALVPDNSAKSAGILLGGSVASSILSLRANDNSGLVVPYTPGTDPYEWRPTPPGFQPALLPNWPQVTPFAMASGAQFRAAAPPAIDSPQYTAEFLEVQSLGSATSATRTPDQTDIARFWADGGGTATPPGHWMRIAQDVATAEGSTLSENARLFALLGIAAADAGISAWDTKYEFNTWRPVTAIQEAGTDGNPDTMPDPAWTPLLSTPPFPSYTSGHSTFSGAASTVLASIFGDDVAFTSSAEGFAVADRSYGSFSEAAEEAGMSRIFGGIHYQADNQAGLLAGRSVGDWVMETQLLPIPEPSSLALLGCGAAALLGLVVFPSRRRRMR